MSTENKPDFEKIAENLIYENLAIDDYPELKADITQALQSAYEAGQPKWEGIDKAPRDGTRVLALSDLFDVIGSVHRGAFTVRWKDAQWETSPVGGITCGPTHYMPIPNPPSVSSVDKGESHA